MMCSSAVQYACMRGWREGSMEGRRDGWSAGFIHGWMGGWMDGRIVDGLRFVCMLVLMYSVSVCVCTS